MTETKEENTQPLYIARIGRVEALVTAEGSGVTREPVAQIRLVVSDTELDADPQAGKKFTMQDIAALEKLCSKLTDTAFAQQTVSFEARPEAPKKPAKKKPAKKRTRKAKKK